nr:uncharacterized protein LOC116765828 isoform X2 [Danaus plexippus plexippus]
MFHVRRRPSDAQPRRRKKKTSVSTGGGTSARALEPFLVEVAPDGSSLENGRRIRINDVIEIGSGNGNSLQLYGPSIQARHCVVSPAEGGGYTVTPLHTDAHVYINGRRAVHTQRLHHSCLLKFGRVSTFRFVDPAQENLLNRNLSQSQHFGSDSIYDRSPSGDTSAAMSPSEADANANLDGLSNDTYPYNNNTLKNDNDSLLMTHLDNKDEYGNEQTGSLYNQDTNRGSNTHYKDNYETTFDLDGNVETKSICSAKSGGSGHDTRSVCGRGQEPILPAVLEFPEAGQAQFLAAVITRLDPHAPAFKLAPVYTLYLCARYRASTHYRPELTPTERAHKLTAFLHHVATLIHATVQERCADSAAQAFWMANASELLHFLKCDRHISSFSTQAQELLPNTVQNAFSNLVTCFQEELSRALVELCSGAGGPGVPGVPGGSGDPTDATAPTLQALAAAMVLLRRCRVNAALTIQLFSHLFHYINAVCFNKLVTEAGTVSARWGSALSARLALVAAWAERQGLELAADCHLARTHQAARLISGTYRNAEEVCGALGACFKLNSVQVRALLSPLLPPDLVEAAVHHARARADELYRADGREITLEESVWLGAALLIPGDGFSAEVVRGVPPGLAEFVAPLQRGGLCRLAHQPHALGLWTVYMHGYGAPAPPPHHDTHPRVQIVQLHKNSNSMGLSIVAAKGAGQSKLGIYIKSVVPGGAAAADGRLAAGDQLLSVDGHSLVGITQEMAAEYLVGTGPTVTLEVAKQGAVLHGLATLLHQPTYSQRQDEEVTYEDRSRRNSGTFTNPHPALLKPTSPLTELVTAGDGRLSYYKRCLLRDETSESSTDETEECRPHYHGSIPKLIITLDRENNQLQEDQSPEVSGYPMEIIPGSGPGPLYPIPVFTFTCDDEAQETTDPLPDTHVPSEEPPIVPEPPAYYDQSSDNGEAIFLPPEMKPIDTKLTLDLFNYRTHEECHRRRCTGVDECVSACECCRTPQPEAQQIPYIDEPNSEPLIFENDCGESKVSTPKIRRILPSLSLDYADDRKPQTADAMCQTINTSIKPPIKPRHVNSKKMDLGLDLNREMRSIQGVHSRLRKTLFSISNVCSSRSDDTDIPSISTSETANDLSYDVAVHRKMTTNHIDIEVNPILDTCERKSWKSPDEFRPSIGKVRALAKHFNQINLRYCAKSYKRNCRSSPNLTVAGISREIRVKDTLPSSTSLADIQYENEESNTDDGITDKMSEDEVKSILIQLEDWSKFGSRGSEDTLAQGNEFELPNLPSEDHTETNVSATGSYVFNEISDKPKKIILDNIKLKCIVPKRDAQAEESPETVTITDSLDKLATNKIKKQSQLVRRHKSSMDLNADCEARRDSAWASSIQSCPELAARDQSDPRHTTPSSGSTRRASERDLPARLAAEPVKPSKSTPALHHAPPPAATAAPASPAQPQGISLSTGGGGGAGSWAHKSRSSHNLTAQNDSFYQNLSSVHGHHPLQDRWSSLRSSSGSGRPQSALFSATNSEQSPESANVMPPHQHQVNQSNAANARAAKVAEFMDEVTRRTQQQHQQPLQQQQYQQQLHHLQQQHQQLHQQQQHQHQQLQHQQQQLQHQQQQIQQKNNVLSQMPQNNQGSPHLHASQQQAQLNMHVHAIQQNQNAIQNHGPMHVHTNTQQMQGQMVGNMQSSPAPLQGHPGPYTQHSPQLPQGMHLNMHQSHPYGQQTHLQGYHNQHGQSQRYDWHPPGPPSPQRSQPPVAPKPVTQAAQASRRTDTEGDDHYQQQQQQQQTLMSNLQPDDERYVASASEPPAVSVYPVGGAGGVSGGRSQPAHNPWQREERERQAEARRAAARARRDAAIAQLVSLGASRTPVQNQQLRALQLERDFERRATQHDDVTGGEGGGEEESPSPEPEPTKEAEREPRQPAPPKSILKSNPRSDLTNGYTSHTTVPEESRVSEVSSSMSCLSVSGSVGAGQAPPPPERGSSFAVMAGRRTDVSYSSHTALTTLSSHQHEPTAAPPPQSPVGSTRDKRVSFHERATPAAPPAPPASSPPPLEPPTPAPTAPTTTHEDPDRFIEEAESILSGPVSPGTAQTAAHTPGVIGAQEVYRDPRTRRLAAEAMARAAAAPVPEQLSFKEKMKMFALESGDPSTPKDKVKISRAQRDIDAVH